MFANRRLAEGGIEHRIMTMRSEERLALADELLERAARYLPLYEQCLREHPLALVEGPAVEVEEQTGGTLPHRPMRRRHA